MLFTRPVSDNPEIKKQYNPETNAREQGHVMPKKKKKTVGLPNSNRKSLNMKVYVSVIKVF